MFDFQTAEEAQVRNPRTGTSGRLADHYIRSGKDGDFAFTTRGWTTLNLDSNGLKVVRDGNGQVALTTQAAEASNFLKGREGAKEKARQFVHRTLRKWLDEAGMADVSRFILNEAGEFQGSTYWVFEALEGDDDSDEETPTGEVEEADMGDEDLPDTGELEDDVFANA